MPTNSRELITEVDKHDNVLGLRPREDFLDGKRIHRSSYLILTDQKGRFLLQQRAKTKKWHPGKYTFPVAGTVADETYEECIKREIGEAFGKNIPHRKVFAYKHFDEVDKAFKTVFIAQSDQENLVPNKKYAKNYIWTLLNELKEDIELHPEKYAPPFLTGMKIYFSKNF